MMRTSNLLLVAVFLTLPMAGAEQEANNHLSAAIEDVALTSGDHVVVELVVGGNLVASQEATVTDSGALEGATASTTTSATSLPDESLEVQVLVDGEVALLVAGRVVGGDEGPMFRTNRVVYPDDSPLEVTGPRLLTLSAGWSRSTVTTAWSPIDSSEGALVQLRAAVPSAEVLIDEEQEVKRTSNGNDVATFAFEYLPPVVEFEATYRSGDGSAVVRHTVDFVTGRSWNGGYEPGAPAIVDGAGMTHEVENVATTVTVPASILEASFPLRAEEDSGDGFTTIGGRTASALALDLSGRHEETAPPTSSAAPKGDESMSTSDLPKQALVPMAVAVALLGAFLLFRRRR